MKIKNVSYLIFRLLASTLRNVINTTFGHSVPQHESWTDEKWFKNKKFDQVSHIEMENENAEKKTSG